MRRAVMCWLKGLTLPGPAPGAGRGIFRLVRRREWKVFCCRLNDLLSGDYERRKLLYVATGCRTLCRRDATAHANYRVGVETVYCAVLRGTINSGKKMGIIVVLIALIILIAYTPILIAGMIVGGIGYWLGHFFSDGWAIFGSILGVLMGLAAVTQQ